MSKINNSYEFNSGNYPENKGSSENVETSYNSIWVKDNDGKIGVNDFELSDKLKDILNFRFIKTCYTWLRNHDKEAWTDALKKQFDNMVNSGTVLRFFSEQDEEGRITGVREADFNKADSNNDGIVDWNELRLYVANSGKDTLIKIANELGIRAQRQNSGEISSSSLRMSIENVIDNMKRADKNADQILTYQEIKASNSTELNNIAGIADDKIDNHQGSYGNCWLLVAQQALRRDNPEVYNKVFQTCNDENSNSLISPDCTVLSKNKKPQKGDVVIKFYGLKDKYNGKIPTVVVKYTAIENQRLQNIRSYNNNSEEKYGSSDPDSVALELAYKILVQSEEKRVVEAEKAYENLCNEYLKNSKPTKEGIVKPKKYVQGVDWRNYYLNSKPTINPKTGKEQQVPNTKFNESGNEYTVLNNDLIDGGSSAKAIEFFIGKKSKSADIDNLKTSFSKSKTYFINFDKELLRKHNVTFVSGKHAYLIKEIKNSTIILEDSQDSNKITEISIEKAKKMFK